MIQFLVGTDWHIRGTKPAIRTDDFLATQWLKVKTVFEYSKKYKVPILHNGDLFEVDKPAFSLINQFLECRKLTPEKMLVNPGNHDLFGANISSLNQTALGILSNSGAIDISPVINYKGVEIYCLPYSLDFNPRQLQIPSKHPDEPQVILTHSMITTRGGLPYEHFPIDTLETGVDLVICGHWHSSFEVKKGWTLFLNAGPLTRQTAHETKIRPSVPLVTIKSRYNIEVEYLPLPYEPYPFDIVEQDIKEADEGIAEAFLSTVAQNQLEAVDLENLLRSTAHQLNFSDITLHRVLEKFQKVNCTWENTDV